MNQENRTEKFSFNSIIQNINFIFGVAIIMILFSNIQIENTNNYILTLQNLSSYIGLNIILLLSAVSFNLYYKIYTTNIKYKQKKHTT